MFIAKINGVKDPNLSITQIEAIKAGYTAAL